MTVRRFRPAVIAVTAVALAVVVTGCDSGGKSDKGAAAASPSKTTPVPVAKPAVAPEPSSKAATKNKSSNSKKKSAKSAKPSGGGGGGDCVTAPPAPEAYDPDEFALYRTEDLPGTPGTPGMVNLVVQHGAWGCPGAGGAGDGDGRPFVGSGEESRWAIAKDAQVTATNPILSTSESKPITVHELTSWVATHPDSGLVFRYTTGADGAIHRLEQVYAP
ncbi:hypothetical protein [Streptomyces sp. NPDC090025]|uniref:hypothetical protein n=1 Tax=Streptomyces sp. NPDC090025 TaxID=3365922 RepID=UPI003836606D